ncbi:MAG: CoA-binding protein [Actinobacteria bacterium]|nr:CoA-binding protein [Actinomycetota bacterium]
MSEQGLVDQFLESRVFAVVGVSNNTEKYGYRVYQDLKRGGYSVYPVNPRCADIEGDACYPDFASLPEKPDVIDFVCPPAVTLELVKEMPAIGVDKAWMQPGAESPEAISFCEDHGIKVLHDICVMVEMRRKSG